MKDRCKDLGTPKTLLECRNVKFSYGGNRVLDGVSLAIHEGSFVGVVGPNGSGKSTLIRILAAGLRPAEGVVLLHESDMAFLQRQRIARELAVVSQEESIDFGFSVREEVMMGRSPHHGGLHFENRTDLAIVHRVMEKAGIAHLASRRTSELSGGERQRVRIARGLAQEPRVLLLDEPTNHLDLYSQLSLMELLAEINEAGLAILLVSHDINFVARTCSDVKILHRSRFLFSGAPSEVITEANLAEAFGIRAIVDTHPAYGSPRMTPVERLAPHGC